MVCSLENELALIVESDETREVSVEPKCKQKINERFSIWYYDPEGLPPLSVAAYSYNAIPKCFGLLGGISLEESGIQKLQNLSPLQLKGRQVLIAVIDTGIQYADSAFISSDGKSRILSIWDQTAPPADAADEPEDGIPLYGRVYAQEEINAALASPKPYELVPQQDEEGHGTLLASIACGSEDRAEDFSGAAPEAQMIVVKLRPANRALKEFYFIPEAKTAYAETDIMEGVAYADRVAKAVGLPLVIFLGLGTNNGSHLGSSPLCRYLNTLGEMQNRAVVLATGNEANSRHHFTEVAKDVLIPSKLEMNVEGDNQGFYVEFWALAPEQFAVSVKSPSGEVAPRGTPVLGGSWKGRFLFEETTLTIDYRNAGRGRRDQLIFIRLENATKGIWTIQVFPLNIVSGRFHAWLPMDGMLLEDVYFLSPNPDTTLTSPSDAVVPMSVGGYDARNGAVFLQSGRGYNTDGSIKPDFIAPAVEVRGKGLRGQYVTGTGTSVASALTAGASALLLEWAVTNKNALEINSVDLQNIFIRGAERKENQTYPNPVEGYGRLNAYQAFENLRR